MTATTVARKARPIWTARCKSGFTYHGKPCNKPCPRGALMCSDCLDAEAVYTLDAIREPRWKAVLAYSAIAVFVAGVFGWMYIMQGVQ